MYRTVDTSAWDDPKIMGLSPEGKLLFFYLFTNRHTHVSGIYYLPDVVIQHETGLPDTVLHTLWDTLSGLNLVLRDPIRQVVWVVNMFRRQGPGRKNAKAAVSQLTTLHKSPLIIKFLEHYPRVTDADDNRVLDTLSHRVSPQEQEQEQDQDDDDGEDSGTRGATESRNPSSPPIPERVLASEARERGEVRVQGQNLNPDRLYGKLVKAYTDATGKSYSAGGGRGSERQTFSEWYAEWVPQEVERGKPLEDVESEALRVWAHYRDHHKGKGAPTIAGLCKAWSFYHGEAMKPARRTGVINIPKHFRESMERAEQNLS